MLATTPLQEISWLYFFFLRLFLFLFNILAERLKLLFDELFEILLGASDRAIVIQDLAFRGGFGRVVAHLRGLFRELLVILILKVILIHALDRPLFDAELPLDVFCLHPPNGLIVEIATYGLFGCRLCRFDAAFHDIDIDALILLNGIQVH
jgi:hypothetical protein